MDTLLRQFFLKCLLTTCCWGLGVNLACCQSTSGNFTGQLVYQLTVLSKKPEVQQMLSTLLPGKLRYAVSGNHCNMRTEGGFLPANHLLDYTPNALSYMLVDTENVAYAMRPVPANRQVSPLKATGKQVSIAGYTCKEYVGKQKSTGNKVRQARIWVADGLPLQLDDLRFITVLSQGASNTLVDNMLTAGGSLGHVPLRVQLTDDQGVTVIYEASEVTAQPVDPTTFEVPKDYRTLNYTQP